MKTLSQIKTEAREALRQRLILWIAPYAYQRANPGGKMDTPSIVYEQVGRDIDATLTESNAVFLDSLIDATFLAIKEGVVPEEPSMDMDAKKANGFSACRAEVLRNFDAMEGNN